MNDGRSLSTRIHGLDSLRAAAVVLVVAYHLAVPHLGGGFLGVTLFFVISGYLITRLLLAEIDRRGAVDLRGFWLRRLRRLLPAAYLLILGCLGAAFVLTPAVLPRYRGDALAALAYSSNWWMIFHHLSYFDSFALPSPMTHLWTLAIEEQFYVVWPLVLVLLLIFVRRRGVIVGMLLAAAAASSILMAVLYQAGDPNRSYMGTDTRGGELLLGAALAIFLHHAADAPASPARLWAARLLATRSALWILVGAAGVFAALAVTLTDQGAVTYRGGIVMAALAGTAMIFALQAPGLSQRARTLDDGVIGGLGRRSYSIYLWHYPILIGLSSAATFGTFSLGRTALVLVLTLAVTEFSYRFVETPIRRLGFKAAARALGARITALPPAPRGVVRGATAVAVLLPTVALLGVGFPAPVNHGPSAVLAGSKPAASVLRPRVAPGHTAPLAPRVQGPIALRVAGPIAPTPQPRPAVVPQRLTGPNTVAVGDSLMIDIAPLIQRALPGISINAQIGRQPWTGLDIATTYRQFNRPGGAYLLGIGTNGAIDVSALADFVRHHRQATVLLITPRVNRPWEGASISAIWQVAHQFHNVRVVDFHGASQAHPEYFGPDGVHLTQLGVRAMVGLVTAAMRR